MTLSQAIERLTQAQPVAGRMERFGGQQDAPLVVVDYAHTPDALEKVLQALREHTDDSLWCVFGCGGDRDRGKRPQMGEIAERLADHVVLTDDNPRNEDPEKIVADIRHGMKREHRVVHRRIEAITSAIESARPGDIILLAGKGHEDYQQIGEERIAYSDRDTVRELLGEAA
jgi:UDP-N-acetylmuramoyl-L-alanyl-D-glutamate--2,6-diaminopimelate ligase